MPGDISTAQGWRSTRPRWGASAAGVDWARWGAKPGRDRKHEVNPVWECAEQRQRPSTTSRLVECSKAAFHFICYSRRDGAFAQYVVIPESNVGSILPMWTSTWRRWRSR